MRHFLVRAMLEGDGYRIFLGIMEEIKVFMSDYLVELTEVPSGPRCPCYCQGLPVVYWRKRVVLILCAAFGLVNFYVSNASATHQ